MSGFARHVLLATTLATLCAPAAAQERPTAPAAPPPVVSPDVSTRTFFSIWRTISSMCLS